MTRSSILSFLITLGGIFISSDLYGGDSKWVNQLQSAQRLFISTIKMINDYAAQAAIYNNLYRHLQEATIDEQRLNDYINNKDIFHPDGERLNMLVQIAIMELRENTHQLIAALNLQNQFLFIGKDIHSFLVALYVIEELKLSIIVQLRQQSISGNYKFTDSLIDCCTAFASLCMRSLKGGQIGKPTS